MMASNGKRITGTCIDCGCVLELFEMDMKKGVKILKCQECGMFHLYKKDFFGAYKVVKVSKDPSHLADIE